jgi:polyisoprenoid-binding protein YceI
MAGRLDGSLLLAALLTAAPGTAADGATYAVASDESSVVIHVGKAGLFAFAGHEHLVAAQRVRGEIHAANGAVSQSRVVLSFEAASLRVDERAEPPGDAAKVQEVMLGPRVLDVARFPTVAFASTAVTGKAAGPSGYELEVTGDLTLHGVTRSVSLRSHVELGAAALKATAHVVLRQTDYGISPVTVAGVVKVKDELAIDFVILARQVPR